MGVNGESTDKKWLKETRVHELIIAARWPVDVLYESKYVCSYISNSAINLRS